MTNSLLLKMAIEIGDFPIEHGGAFHSYVAVYRRVITISNLGDIIWYKYDLVAFSPYHMG